MSRYARETKNIFNNIFAYIKHHSAQAVIHLVNGLYGTDHPLNSSVDYPSTEYIDSGYKQNLLDLVIRIDNSLNYHIETQIQDDESMALRMFQYGFLLALHNKATDKRESALTFPKAITIYLEPTGKTPDQETLKLVFPDDSQHIYQTGTFKYFDYSIDDLVERNMEILLPFYAIKLRHQADSANTTEQRQELTKELVQISSKITQAAYASYENHKISYTDGETILDCTETIIRQLYADKYDEFKEALTMVQFEIERYSQKYINQTLQTERQAMQQAMQNERQSWQSKEQSWQSKERKTVQNLVNIGMKATQIANVMGLSVDNVTTIIHEETKQEEDESHIYNNWNDDQDNDWDDEI
jgi:hypothetical protein